MTELIPPDREQCQAEKPTGSFMTFGIPKPARCTNKPDWIATEINMAEDGLKGSMSLCDDCRHVLEKQKPGHASFIRIM